MSLILMTTLFYKALPLQGEIWCWSLLGIKGLNTSKCETSFDPPTAMGCFEESDKHCYWYLLIIITFRPLSYNQDSDCNQTFFVCKMQQSIFLMWTSKEKWRKLNPSLMQISAECHIITVVLHPLLWDWGKGASAIVVLFSGFFGFQQTCEGHVCWQKQECFPLLRKNSTKKCIRDLSDDFTTRGRSIILRSSQGLNSINNNNRATLVKKVWPLPRN